MFIVKLGESVQKSGREIITEDRGIIPWIQGPEFAHLGESERPDNRESATKILPRQAGRYRTPSN